MNGTHSLRVGEKLKYLGVYEVTVASSFLHESGDDTYVIVKHTIGHQPTTQANLKDLER